MKRHRKKSNHEISREASYVCGACGEEIVVPVDISAGSQQDYVEDCPVCCRPNLIHVDLFDLNDIRIWAELEDESA